MTRSSLYVALFLIGFNPRKGTSSGGSLHLLYGVLRCVSNPAGTAGYDELQNHAEWMEIDGMRTSVADLADLIRMKEAFDRDKDRSALVTLRAIQRLRGNT